MFNEREKIRALEATLTDVRNNGVITQQMVQKAYAEEQVRWHKFGGKQSSLQNADLLC